MRWGGGKFGLTAELAYNLGSDDKHTGYNFYTAASLSFGLAEKLQATATGKLLLSPNDELPSGHDLDWGNGYGAAFALDYEVNERNMVGAEVQVNIIGDYWDFAVPVYWKYTLNY